MLSCYCLCLWLLSFEDAASDAKLEPKLGLRLDQPTFVLSLNHGRWWHNVVRRSRTRSRHVQLAQLV
jgi:hypothetical protein